MRVAAHLAVQDRHQPVPQRAPRGEPAPGQEVGYVAVPTARADPARRGRLAAAVSRRPPRGRRRPAARARGPLRAERSHLAGLRDRPAGAAAAPARRPHLARCPRIPRQRGGRHAGGDRRIGQQRPQTSPRQPAAPAAAGRRPPPAAGSPAEDAIVAMFARAWESADLDALVALLTDDVFIAMPPMPFGYEGRELVARYWARQFAAGRRFDLVPARANGQPAFGAYLRGPAGIRHAAGFYVLTLAGDRICAMTRFEASVLPWFGLPRSLPRR